MLSTVRDGLLRTYLRTPEHAGKYRVVRWLGKRVFPREGIRARVDHDLELTLHPRDWIEYLLLRGDRYEPMTLDFLTRNLRKGDTAVLAGVNFGQHVAVAARAVGQTGTVIGVEPQPAALLRTAENLRRNGLGARVRLVSAALGDRPEFLPMAWAPTDNAGAASLLSEGDGYIVPVFPLPRVTEALGSVPLRLLLLDVEGFEAKVLQGLDRNQVPEIVVVELAPENVARAGMTIAGVLDVIRGLGYETRTLVGNDVIPGGDVPERNVVGVSPGSEVVWATADATR